MPTKRLKLDHEKLKIAPNKGYQNYFHTSVGGYRGQEEFTLIPIAFDIAPLLPVLSTYSRNSSLGKLKAAYTKANPFQVPQNKFIRELLMRDKYTEKFSLKRLDSKGSYSESPYSLNLAFWGEDECLSRSCVRHYYRYNENKDPIVPEYIIAKYLDKSPAFKELSSRFSFKDRLEIDLVGGISLVIIWENALHTEVNVRERERPTDWMKPMTDADILGINCYWEIPRISAYTVHVKDGKEQRQEGGRIEYFRKIPTSYTQGEFILGFENIFLALQRTQERILTEHRNEYSRISLRMEELGQLFMLGNALASFLDR